MKKLEIAGKTYTYTELTPETSIDDILRIDLETHRAKAMNFPVVMHAIGVEKNEVETSVRLLKKRISIREIELTRSLNDRYREIKQEKKLTESMIKAAIAQEMTQDDILCDLYDRLESAEVSLAHIQNLYWAAKQTATQLSHSRID